MESNTKNGLKEIKKMILTSEQIEFLKKNIDGFDKFLELDDVDGLLDAISDYQLKVGFQKNDEPNELGLRIEQIYDEVLDQNDEE